MPKDIHKKTLTDFCASLRSRVNKDITLVTGEVKNGTSVIVNTYNFIRKIYMIVEKSTKNCTSFLLQKFQGIQK